MRENPRSPEPAEPHAASGTAQPRKAMGKLMRNDLEARMAGKPLLTPVA